VENTHPSSTRRGDGQHVVRGRRSTTFAGRRSAEKSQHGGHGKWSMTSSDQCGVVFSLCAGTDKSHTNSRRSDSQGVGAGRPRRTAAINAQRAIADINQRATRSGSQRDESSHLLSDACVDGDLDVEEDSDTYVSSVEDVDLMMNLMMMECYINSVNLSLWLRRRSQ